MRASPPGVGLGLYRARPTRQLLEAALSLGVRHLDTAYSYHQFTGHGALASVGGGLLPEFTVSTKVGFFPGGRHSLDPRELAQSVRRSCDDLGHPPGVIMLHNPEQTLRDTDPVSACRALESACAALAQAADVNECGGWGISTWDAATLGPIAAGLPAHVRPDALMTRAGLTVSVRQLRAARDLARRLRPRSAWGMSPFGGAPRDPIWNVIDARDFLIAGARHARHQAAFRVACELPRVDLVIAGTSDPAHLRELVAASRLSVDHATIGRYVSLLEARASAPAPGGLKDER